MVDSVKNYCLTCGVILRIKKIVYFRNVRNSSFVKSASDMIAINSVVFVSLCFGTGTMFSFLMRIRWLPFCRAI